MGEENTESDIARASEVGNNLLETPVESVNDTEQESIIKKGNDENVGVEETIEVKICSQFEDSEGKENSSKRLSVEENEQTAVVPRYDAESVIVTKDTEEPKEGKTKEFFELEVEKNDTFEQDIEPKEREITEVDELEGGKNEATEQDNEPQDVASLDFAGQDGEIRLTLGENIEVTESDASERISKAAAADETPKKEIFSVINLETKAANEDGQMNAARDVNEGQIEDTDKVKQDQKNQGDIDKEKMEVELEPKAVKSDNESIRVEINLEGKGFDVEKGSEPEKVEGKLEGSSNEEDIQDDAKGSKKLKRNENYVDKAKGGKKDEESQKTPVFSVSTRPVRERKSVERLVASVEKEVIREIFVEKGPGVALIDIPNVAYKLSKKTNDETFKQLHTILFGRRGKAIQMKNHISQFSGFVWHDNEEKNKMKIREKFDKLVKEKLIEICDVLDIPITNKVSTKKEDVVTRIMEFLASPHSTTDELLSEKEHPAKRKRSVGPGSPTHGSANSSRKRKRTSEKLKETAKGESGSKGESDREDEALTEDQGNGNGDLNQSENESSEKKLSESEDAMDEDTKRFKKTAVKVSAKRRTKKSDPSDSEEEKKGDAKQSLNISSDKVGSTRKARNSNVTTEKKKQVKDAPEKELNNKTKNADTKGKPKEEKLKPSDKVLRNQICQILKEVDFNTATFTDILKLLGKHFKIDLTPRKASIKLIIQEELTKIADAADDDDDEEEEEQNVAPEPTEVKA